MYANRMPVAKHANAAVIAARRPACPTAKRSGFAAQTVRNRARGGRERADRVRPPSAWSKMALSTISGTSGGGGTQTNTGGCSTRRRGINGVYPRQSVFDPRRDEGTEAWVRRRTKNRLSHRDSADSCFIHLTVFRGEYPRRVYRLRARTHSEHSRPPIRSVASGGLRYAGLNGRARAQSRNRRHSTPSPGRSNSSGRLR